MMSQSHTMLSDDHQAVNEVLKQLLTALNNKDVKASYSKLDLLWARLAVHIRAEHLHLFPSVASRLSDAQPIIDNLRADHDFFMRELARAVGTLRELPTTTASASDEAKLTDVCEAVRQIEKRLVSHNASEESQIYHRADMILTKPEQMELATRINTELENRPPRFSAEAWANCL